MMFHDYSSIIDSRAHKKTFPALQVNNGGLGKFIYAPLTRTGLQVASLKTQSVEPPPYAHVKFYLQRKWV